MKKNRLGSAEVGSCICYGLMALLQVGWLAVLLTAQLVPPVWVTLMVYCVALALFLLGQTLRDPAARYGSWRRTCSPL